MKTYVMLSYTVDNGPILPKYDVTINGDHQSEYCHSLGQLPWDKYGCIFHPFCISLTRMIADQCHYILINYPHIAITRLLHTHNSSQKSQQIHQKSPIAHNNDDR